MAIIDRKIHSEEFSLSSTICPFRRFGWPLCLGTALFAKESLMFAPRLGYDKAPLQPKNQA